MAAFGRVRAIRLPVLGAIGVNALFQTYAAAKGKLSSLVVVQGKVRKRVRAIRLPVLGANGESAVSLIRVRVPSQQSQKQAKLVILAARRRAR